MLSEFAGAAAELDGGIVMNPYDVDGVAESIRPSLSMPSPCDTPSGDVGPDRNLATVLADARTTRDLRLLLDYDGTLVPLARSPELAAPDPEVLALLAALARCRMLKLEMVSGRPRETLEAWFGALPVALWAEHAFWYRPSPGTPWEAAAPVDSDWTERVLPILRHFTDSTPGSRIEKKTASIAWHYRGAQRDFGWRQAHELRMLLGDALSNQPLEVLEGKKVIEVRFRGISKAVVAQRGQPVETERLTVAFGDDRTDEDLFRVLPPSSVTIAVGQPLVGSRYRVADYRAVRQILRTLIVDLPAMPASA